MSWANAPHPWFQYGIFRQHGWSRKSNLGSQTASGVVSTCMGDRRHPCPFGAASDYNIFYYFSLDNNKLKTIKCLWKHEYLFISWLSLIIQRPPIALRVASIPQPWRGVRSAGLTWGPPGWRGARREQGACQGRMLDLSLVALWSFCSLTGPWSFFAHLVAHDHFLLTYWPMIQKLP